MVFVNLQRFLLDKVLSNANISGSIISNSGRRFKLVHRSVLMTVNAVSSPLSNSYFKNDCPEGELVMHWSLHQGWLHQFYRVYLGFSLINPAKLETENR